MPLTVSRPGQAFEIPIPKVPKLNRDAAFDVLHRQLIPPLGIGSLVLGIYRRRQSLCLNCVRGNPTQSKSSQDNEDVDRGIKLTVDTYTHWMPGKNREAMDRLPVLETAIH